MRTRMVGALSATVLVLALVGALGCGGAGGYDNAARPPAVRTLSIEVTGSRVAVSPARIGAGPTLLLIANESGRSREVTLTASAGSRGRSCVEADASSGPINPQSTARLQLPLVEGVCALGVADGALAAARLTVGPERESSQQDLLQP
jgi:hypothetical protein